MFDVEKYIELIREFPLVPIPLNDDGLLFKQAENRVQEILSISDHRELTPEEDVYLATLSDLLWSYEDKLIYEKEHDIHGVDLL
jgi:hypothetical protein